MELSSALEGRYSCRSFTDQAPTHAQIERVLEAGRLAPTACNNQPQRLFVLTDPEHLAKLDEVTRCRYNAQCAIIVGYSKSEAADHAMIDPDEPWSFGEQDATSVLVHMLLAAHDLGLETCWIGAFCEEACRRTFSIPEDIRVIAIIDLGFPSENGQPSARHEMRKPLEETVVWL